jgi:hypothetical protein
MDDEQQAQEQSEAQKFQSAMMMRYRPEAHRADRLAANIPGGHTSSFGTNADHMIGHGGSN